MESIWTYNEFVQIGTDFTDIKKVETYDNMMLKFRNYKQEVELIFKTLNIDSNDTLLEIGTGTGHFAIEAAKKCKKGFRCKKSGYFTKPVKDITNRTFIYHKQVNNDTKSNSYSLKRQ